MNKQRLHDGRLVVNGKRGQGVPDVPQQIITPTVRYGTGDCGLQREKYRFEKDTRCKGCEGGFSLQEERGANLPFVTHCNSVQEHGEWMKACLLAAGRERAMSTGNSEMLLLPFRKAYRTIRSRTAGYQLIQHRLQYFDRFPAGFDLDAAATHYPSQQPIPQHL